MPVAYKSDPPCIVNRREPPTQVGTFAKQKFRPKAKRTRGPRKVGRLCGERSGSPSSAAVICKSKSRQATRTCRDVVEARRVELLSENHLPRVSPSAVDVLNFPCRIAHRQAMRFGSSLCVTRLGAIPCSHLPLIDAPYTVAVLRAGTSSLRC